MKFTSVLYAALASSLVASSPLPKVKTAFVTQFTTVKVTSGTVSTLITPTAAATTVADDADAAKVTGNVNAAVKPDDDDHKDDDHKDDNKDNNKNPASTLPLASPASSSSAAPSSTSSSDEEGHGDKYTGEVTYYNPDVGLTSCGGSYGDDDWIVAISTDRQNEIKAAHKQANNNANPVCGAKIKATNPETGNSVVVTVVDTCASCKRDDLDVTEAAFKKLTGGSLDAGRLKKIEWQWVDKDF